MFTNTELKAFRQDFEVAVKDLEKKYALSLRLGSISVGDIEFHTTLRCTKTTATGERMVNMNEFEFLKKLLGFKGNIGDKYKGSDGYIYTITGLDGKKPKYPVLTEREDGKRFKTTIPSANFAMLLKLK